jgi:uncharacterized membrane protein
MAELLFSEEDKKSITVAIASAEQNTSGEIRVHIENHCKLDVLDRAAEVFAILKMNKTQLRNGVLIYLAVKDHKFAIIGDAGINAVVPKDFWELTKDKMKFYFKEGKFTQGLCYAIDSCGSLLKDHFPFKHDDQNELSNDISFGKN